mmetsp:Transcript_18899/g.40869  ORF Transcript_18899/g.40869 Transcript_18899/m.40869 type:complete len:576 (-) Transcript_18899:70-1797(-)
MTGHGFNSNARKTPSPLAFVTFFKSLFGAGLLALPNVLGKVGLALGAAIYLGVALGCSFSCYLLLRAREVTARFVLEHELNNSNSNRDDINHGSGVDGGMSSRKRIAAEYLRGQEEEQGAATATEYVAQHDDSTDAIPAIMNGGSSSPHHQHHHHLVTYGDLADVLFGKVMASVTRWTIIVLNILFTSGLVIVVCENLGGFLPTAGGDSNADADAEDGMAGRRMVSIILLPLVAALVQIPWLQDMWIISAIGLVVYTVGVIGSSLYSALWTIVAGEASGRTMPTELWEIKWDGIGYFLGTAVYALEGINLALPTVHSMQHPGEASWVVCGALMLYGATTLVFAAIGYAGGLGGGDGTGLSSQDCDVVTNCITPSSLQTTIQVTLSIAMVLSIPVMLYPSTEMLEVMLTDRQEEKEEKLDEWKRRNAGSDGVELQSYSRSESKTKLVAKKGTGIDAYGTSGDGEDSLVYDADGQQVEAEFSQDKSWKLRLFLSALTVALGGTMNSFTYFSGFVGAVGLSFAGFVLPTLLYVRAMQRANLRISWGTMVMLAVLLLFGLYNMIVGGTSNLVRLVQSFG